MPLTVAEAKFEIAEAANDCQSNIPRVCSYINKAVRRLLTKGKWKNTYQRIRICATSGCFTWPREVETIESISICGNVGNIRNLWYEFNPNGPGPFQSGNCNGNDLVDRGMFPTFDRIHGNNKQLRVYRDIGADDGKTITFRGLDDEGNVILTDNGNTEGEVVTLASPYTDTVSPFFWHDITGVIKDVTKGPVRVYEYDTVTTVQRLIAIYQPDETLPSYRRSYYPPANIEIDPTSEECQAQLVDVIAKLRFIPVRKESDFILIENLPALCEEVRAVRKFENNLIAEGLAYEALAVKYLNEELQNYLGDSTKVALHVEGASPYGSEPIMNIL